MTIQWTVVAAFLYLELAFIFLLILPIIPPKMWRYIFYSRFFKGLANKANVYFTVFIIVLIFFFLDSIREMWNYSSASTTQNVGQELMNHLKLFRSQRNYFISGFAVFLWLVIRRLVVLVLCEADLLSENESAMKRAQNATETVEKILKQREEVDKGISLMTKMYAVETEELHKAIEDAKNELNSIKKETEDIKQRSDAVTADYEILLEKHETLLSKTIESDNQSKPDNKKDDEDEIADVDEEEESDSDEEEEDLSASK